MNTTLTQRPSAWLAIGVLALATLGAGCDRRSPSDPVTPSTSTTAPMSPASAASR